MRAGEHYKNVEGKEYIINQVFEHKKHIDLSITFTETGEKSSLRVKK